MNLLNRLTQKIFYILMFCAFINTAELSADLYVQQIATIKKINESKKFTYFFTFLNMGTEDITFDISDMVPQTIDLLSVGYTTSPICIDHTQNSFTPGFGGEVSASITICAGQGFNVALNCKAANSLPAGTVITNTITLSNLTVGLAPDSVLSVSLPTSRK